MLPRSQGFDAVQQRHRRGNVSNGVTYPVTRSKGITRNMPIISKYQITDNIVLKVGNNFKSLSSAPVQQPFKG
jgi:hypothetical protein